MSSKPGSSSHSVKEMMREKASQARRAMLTQQQALNARPPPLFGEPVKISTVENDATAERAKQVLGDFDQLQPYVTNHPHYLLGISKTMVPQSPIITSQPPPFVASSKPQSATPISSHDTNISMKSAVQNLTDKLNDVTSKSGPGAEMSHGPNGVHNSLQQRAVAHYKEQSHPPASHPSNIKRSHDSHRSHHDRSHDRPHDKSNDRPTHERSSHDSRSHERSHDRPYDRSHDRGLHHQTDHRSLSSGSGQHVSGHHHGRNASRSHGGMDPAERQHKTSSLSNSHEKKMSSITTTTTTTTSNTASISANTDNPSKSDVTHTTSNTGTTTVSDKCSIQSRNEKSDTHVSPTSTTKNGSQPEVPHSTVNKSSLPETVVTGMDSKDEKTHHHARGTRSVSPHPPNGVIINGLMKRKQANLPKINITLSEPQKQAENNQNVDMIMEEMILKQSPLTGIRTPRKEKSFPFIPTVKAAPVDVVATDKNHVKELLNKGPMEDQAARSKKKMVSAHSVGKSTLSVDLMLSSESESESKDPPPQPVKPSVPVKRSEVAVPRKTMSRSRTISSSSSSSNSSNSGSDSGSDSDSSSSEDNDDDDDDKAKKENKDVDGGDADKNSVDVISIGDSAVTDDSDKHTDESWSLSTFVNSHKQGNPLVSATASMGFSLNEDDKDDFFDDLFGQDVPDSIGAEKPATVQLSSNVTDYSSGYRSLPGMARPPARKGNKSPGRILNIKSPDASSTCSSASSRQGGPPSVGMENSVDSEVVHTSPVKRVHGKDIARSHSVNADSKLTQQKTSSSLDDVPNQRTPKKSDTPSKKHKSPSSVNSINSDKSRTSVMSSNKNSKLNRSNNFSSPKQRQSRVKSKVYVETESSSDSSDNESDLDIDVVGISPAKLNGINVFGNNAKAKLTKSKLPGVRALDFSSPKRAEKSNSSVPDSKSSSASRTKSSLPPLLSPCSSPMHPSSVSVNEKSNAVNSDECDRKKERHRLKRQKESMEARSASSSNNSVKTDQLRVNNIDTVSDVSHNPMLHSESLLNTSLCIESVIESSKEEFGVPDHILSPLPNLPDRVIPPETATCSSKEPASLPVHLKLSLLEHIKSLEAAKLQAANCSRDCNSAFKGSSDDNSVNKTSASSSHKTKNSPVKTCSPHRNSPEKASNNLIQNTNVSLASPRSNKSSDAKSKTIVVSCPDLAVTPAESQCPLSCESVDNVKSVDSGLGGTDFNKNEKSANIQTPIHVSLPLTDSALFLSSSVRTNTTDCSSSDTAVIVTLPATSTRDAKPSATVAPMPQHISETKVTRKSADENSADVMAQIFKNSNSDYNNKIPKRRRTSEGEPWSKESKRAKSSSSKIASSSRTVDTDCNQKSQSKASEYDVQHQQHQRRGSSASSCSSSSQSSNAHRDQHRKKAKLDNLESSSVNNRHRSRHDNHHSHAKLNDTVSKEKTTVPFAHQNNHSPSQSPHPVENSHTSQPSGKGENWRLDRRRKPVEESLLSAQEHLTEATKLKHEADHLTDRLSKSLRYIEAVVSFLLCGSAMEQELLSDQNNIFAMYNDTLKLIMYICRRSNQHESDMSEHEKRLHVLVLRIQSLLYLKLYKLKKTEAMKLKRAIDDYYKSTSSSKQMSAAHAPSPHQSNWNKSTGTPSPMSPTPSPAGSITSVGSQDSIGHVSSTCKFTNGSGGGTSSGSMASPAGTVGIPQRVHSMIQQYMTFTGYLTQCHDLWMQSDVALTDNKAFFDDLDHEYGPTTLHSSIRELVYYVRQGLHALKETT